MFNSYRGHQPNLPHAVSFATDLGSYSTKDPLATSYPLGSVPQVSGCWLSYVATTRHK